MDLGCCSTVELISQFISGKIDNLELARAEYQRKVRVWHWAIDPDMVPETRISPLRFLLCKFHNPTGWAGALQTKAPRKVLGDP